MTIKFKALIIPHFEVGKIYGDFPGEAQYFYEYYFKNCEEFRLLCGETLYVNRKLSLGLFITGSGKTLTAMTLSSVLSDSRFDFSQAYIISPGCAGGNYENTVYGDICVVYAAADFDLGHYCDSRDCTDTDDCGWYRDRSYDKSAYAQLNESLSEKVFSILSGHRPQTTPLCDRLTFNNAKNRGTEYRAPAVIRGTALTGDCFWKGKNSHKRAIMIADNYGSKYPYTVTEMEDAALCVTASYFGLLNRVIILRAVVNDDLFADGETPLSAWGGETAYNNGVEDGETKETADIFPTAMKNLFTAGKAVTDAVLNGEL